MQSNDIDILARTIYGEARGEYACLEGGLASLIGVGNVVMNRLNVNPFYGSTIQDICHKPFQFSCWNQNDSNRELLLRGDIHDPVFTLCCEVATKIVRQEWPDLTKGSDHYHSTSLPQIPYWARGQKPKVRLARHVFYQLIEGE
jgi:N-acetylmuramoyl-L-alanine amidase